MTVQPDQKGQIAPLVRGALAAVFCPYLFMALVGPLISWRDALPNAHSPQEAVIQAIEYIPGVILIGPITVLFTAPAILVWLFLRRMRWASWYVCIGIGALTGWGDAILLLSNVQGNSDYGRHMRELMQVEMAIAGLLTGFAVWLAARAPLKGVRASARA